MIQQQLLEKAKVVSPGPADEFIASTYELNKFQLEPAAVIQLNQCETYDVINRIKTTTTINTEEEQPGYVSFVDKIKFNKRRISSQFKSIMHQLSIQGNSTKRPIALQPDDFL